MANISDTMSTYTTFKQGDVIPEGFPMAGTTVAQGFNDKTTKHKGHLGYDMGPTDGLAHAIFDGTVALMGFNTGNGNCVCLKHQIGSTVFYSAYSHLAKFQDGLKEGSTIARGGIVGTVGATGDFAGDPHLHLSVFTAEKPSNNPMGYCNAGSATFEQTAGSNANEYYYGSDATRFPNCGGLCFYDPYGVISTNGSVLRYSDYSIYDVNHDGVVDQLDLTRAQRHYGHYDPLSDINGDGIVDISDLILIMNNYDS